jgi:MFS transporter, NNP family, nitrate/nitrite transporter
VARIRSYFGQFSAAGHAPTLWTSLFYFDMCFAVWVLNGAMAPFISEAYQLSPAQTGLMVSVPVLAGALMRLPLGILSEYIGRKNAALLNMAIVIVGLLFGFFFADSYADVLLVGIPLGVAGASFGVALSLGSGSFPARYKGMAMGIVGAGNSGAVLAVLFAPPLARAYGWHHVYGLAMLPMAFAFVLLLLLAREPEDRERKPLRDYLKLLLDRDIWIFNLMYMVTFGGYIGLTSFLPTLFHDQYGIAKENIGPYAAATIIAASLLRVVGGSIADRIGGLRMLLVLSLVIAAASVAAATLPASAWLMVAILIVCFGAMGAGNGAVFQLVPLRFKSSTATASSLIGEIGALAGGLLPNAMGIGKQMTGSFAPGFLCGLLLSVAALMALLAVTKQWTSSWIGAGGRALEPS